MDEVRVKDGCFIFWSLSTSLIPNDDEADGWYASHALSSGSQHTDIPLVCNNTTLGVSGLGWQPMMEKIKWNKSDIFYLLKKHKERKLE